MTLGLMFIVFAGLTVLGVPVAVGMGLAAVLFLFDHPIFTPMIMAQRMPQGLFSFPQLAIPLFILAGHLLNQAGIAARIFTFAGALVGHIRGGLAHVNVVASMIFAGMSGVAAADAAGLGAVEIRAMKRAGFTAAFSAAVTAASALIGPIIPPSVVMVLYAVMAQVSIGEMFLAGIVPGFLMGALLMGMIYVMALRGVIDVPMRKRATAPQLGRAFLAALPALFAPVLLVGGLLLGVATPTELGALTCVYATALGVAYRSLTWRRLGAALSETISTCGVILLLIAVGVPFSWLVAVNNLPQQLAAGLLGISDHPLVVLLIINLGLLVAGAVMETAAILLIAVPLLFPVVLQLGIDPVHFGIIMVLNLVVGVTTPPFGMILFIMMDVAKVRMGELVRHLLPFYLPLLAVLILVILFPAITLTLPQVLR